MPVSVATPTMSRASGYSSLTTAQQLSKKVSAGDPILVIVHCVERRQQQEDVVRVTLINRRDDSQSALVRRRSTEHFKDGFGQVPPFPPWLAGHKAKDFLAILNASFRDKVLFTSHGVEAELLDQFVPRITYFVRV